MPFHTENNIANHEYGFRVTTKPLSERQVSFRWRDLSDSGYDVYKIAKVNDLFKAVDNESVIHQSYQDAFHGISRYSKIKPGIDISAENGLEKIWLFFDTVIPISTLNKHCQRENKSNCLYPESIGKYEEFFQKYAIQEVNIMGFDFKNDSINVYTNTPTSNVLNKMCKDLGLANCNLFDELPFDQLMGLNFTFDWKVPNIIRFCAYWIPGEKPHIPDEVYQELPNINELPYFEESATTRNWNNAVAVDKNNHYGKLEWIMPNASVVETINKYNETS